MAVLHLLSYLGGLAGFLFVTLSLASGLLWLAELIEEHSRYAKVIGMRAIYGIIALHFILIFTDSLPILPTILGVASHLVYLSNFSATWPYISLTSPKFIASCILVVADHFTWFFHFTAKANEAKRLRQPKYRYGGGAYNDGPAFMDVAAFFAVCVWFIPLFLFLSLSANDNALPSFDATPSGANTPVPQHIDLSTPDYPPRQNQARTSTSLVKSTLAPVLSLLPRLRGSRKKNEEGLIAPRTPIRGSPLHSPVNMGAQGSYFPWGEESSSAQQSNMPIPNLGSDSVRNRTRTPPPPRRIQSDAQLFHGINPRGLATRNGKAVGVEQVAESAAESVGAGGDAIASDSIKMSLGPASGEALSKAQVLESTQGPSKKKND